MGETIEREGKAALEDHAGQRLGGGFGGGHSGVMGRCGAGTCYGAGGGVIGLGTLLWGWGGWGGVGCAVGLGTLLWGWELICGAGPPTRGALCPIMGLGPSPQGSEQPPVGLSTLL